MKMKHAVSMSKLTGGKHHHHHHQTISHFVGQPPTSTITKSILIEPTSMLPRRIFMSNPNLSNINSSEDAAAKRHILLAIPDAPQIGSMMQSIGGVSRQQIPKHCKKRSHNLKDMKLTEEVHRLLKNTPLSRKKNSNNNKDGKSNRMGRNYSTGHITTVDVESSKVEHLFAASDETFRSPPEQKRIIFQSVDAGQSPSSASAMAVGGITIPRQRRLLESSSPGTSRSVPPPQPPNYFPSSLFPLPVQQKSAMFPPLRPQTSAFSFDVLKCPTCGVQIIDPTVLCRCTVSNDLMLFPRSPSYEMSPTFDNKTPLLLPPPIARSSPAGPSSSQYYFPQPTHSTSRDSKSKKISLKKPPKESHSMEKRRRRRRVVAMSHCCGGSSTHSPPDIIDHQTIVETDRLLQQIQQQMDNSCSDDQLCLRKIPVATTEMSFVIPEDGDEEVKLITTQQHQSSLARHDDDDDDDDDYDGCGDDYDSIIDDVDERFVCRTDFKPENVTRDGESALVDRDVEFIDDFE